MLDFVGSEDDYFYLGVGFDAASLGQIDSRLSQYLTLVGHARLSDEQSPKLAADFRILQGHPIALGLPSGLYLKRSAGKYQAVQVLFGADSVPEYSVSSVYHVSDPAFDLFQEFDDLWGQAEALSADSPFKSGDWALLKFKDEFVQVVDVAVTSGGYSIEIDNGDSGRTTVLPNELTLLAGDPRRVETWRRQPPAKGSEFLRTLAWAKLHYPLTNVLYSFAATQTVFRPYQFLPALKMIKSQRGRILVADEVGLGKTIEAGLIWTELEQRERLNRVLVIAPSSLTNKWREEMRRRFMREMQIFRIKDLEEYLESLEVNPDAPLSAIMSLETLRGRASIQEMIEESEIEFDLVIIDEAHALRNKGTQGNNLAQIIADNTRFFVLLSATPLNLGREDLFNLMNLLEPHQFPDFQVFQLQVEPNKHLLEARRLALQGESSSALRELGEIGGLQFGAPLVERPAFKKLEALLSSSELSVEDKARINSLVNELNTLSTTLNRTRKADTKDFQATRRSETIEVSWTDEEWEFYEAVRAHFIEKARMSKLPRGFILQMPLRQTCSSLPVMAANLRDKQLLAEELIEEDEFFEYEVDELQALRDVGQGSVIDVKVPSVDSKLKEFLTLLERLRGTNQDKVLVFSFFRGTVNYLVEQLQKRGFNVRGIHGGISPFDRYQMIKDFRAGAFDIMISNQVGAEGLDFEFCSTLINYDLPWNPMQVEQRIGRLDRFGQKNEVISIYNLVVPGTIEFEIYSRLYDRIKIFTSTVGDLELILQATFKPLLEITVDPNLTPDEIRQRVEKEAIAIENEANTRQSVEEERQHLSILDQLEVEGLSESGPRKGMYMSPAEILGHLEYLADFYGASAVAQTDDLSLVKFCGNAKIASAVAKSKMLEVGSQLGVELISRLRSEEPILFVLDSRILSGALAPNEETEIISSRHPLVRMAQLMLRESSLLSGRFTDLTIENTDFRGRYLAQWSIFETYGVDKISELWVTAIDLDSGKRNPEVEEFLLANPNELRLSKVSSLSRLTDSEIQVVREAEADRFQEAREERQRENSALLSSRVEAELAVANRKLQSDLARHQTNIDNQRGQGILRMGAKKIENSRARIFDIEEEFEKKGTLSALSHKVALAKVTF